MSYKFDKLDVWNLAVEYIDLIYSIAQQLPHIEDYCLRSQILRASNSVALNIAEGSTSQSNAEQARFIYELQFAL
jgi:four helix bundle protein